MGGWLALCKLFISDNNVPQSASRKCLFSGSLTDFARDAGSEQADVGAERCLLFRGSNCPVMSFNNLCGQIPHISILTPQNCFFWAMQLENSVWLLICFIFWIVFLLFGVALLTKKTYLDDHGIFFLTRAVILLITFDHFTCMADS